MDIRDVGGKPLRRIPKRLGTIFFIGDQLFKRGRGILLRAGKGIDPTVSRAFWKREKRRQRSLR